jgi:predicted RNase H-like nuclease (RuvC/YqgF family)
MILAAEVPNIALYAGALAAVVGAVIALAMFGPNRRGVLITNEQGAAKIYDDLVDTLQAEVERQRGEISALRAELEGERAERRRLENAADGLRRRFGTRDSDGEDADEPSGG